MVFQLSDFSQADEEGHGSEDAEAAVHEPPEGWDAAERTRDQRQRQDADARENAELENPLIADGVGERAEEGDGEDQVREGEPVGAIGEEGRAQALLGERDVDAIDPGDDWGRQKWVGCEQAGEERSLIQQREGSDAGEDEAGDEDAKPDADGTELDSFG